MRYKGVLLAAWLMLTANNAAQAQVQLTAEAGYNDSGRLEVLLEFDIARGWHIFAPLEQEFGQPLKVDWQQPANAVEVSFSRPVTYSSEMFSYMGYAGKAYWKTTLEVEDETPQAIVSWQACAGDECVPQSNILTIDKQNINRKRFEEKLQAAERTFVTEQNENDFDWLAALVGALIGGIILNLMPCVLPVLGFKLITLAKTPAAHRRSEAVVYTLGVLASMLVLALILLVLRQANPHLGWGFQMQSPLFIAAMLVLFVVLTLVLFEKIHISGSWLNKLNNIHFTDYRAEAFGSGVLSVLVASPCTAPFMGTAVGYALFAPTLNYMAVFCCLGLGYAAPFALLALFPKAVSRILPKPGKWMNIFKAILGIPLVCTIVWLAWVLLAQTGVLINQRHLQWEEYSLDKVEAALQVNRPVLIDFTADWCITCLVNKKTALQSNTMAQIAQEKNILLLKADITTKNSKAAAGLGRYGRASVPLYVYYDGKSEDYVILPQILTPQILQEYIR
ncbi:MAG: thioredoxin family protein [Alphaproteobacteria bacterium]|nr:thioredoxin family protein [Alphaproteobacteria bacterium]